jgi:hypothetical protein
VATPNKQQNQALGELLSWSICPDMAGDKWELHFITYTLSDLFLDETEEVIVTFVDKTNTIYQCYVIDVTGNTKRSYFNVQ